MSALSISHRVAGGLGLAAGVSAVLGGSGPLLEVRSASALGVLLGDAPATAPDVPAARWAIAAGVLLVVAGAGLLVPRAAGRLRPALSVLWAAPIPAALSALRTASAAVDASVDPDPFLRLAAPTLGLGWGAWLLVAAIALASATGLACVVAGVFDREEWDGARELAASAERSKNSKDKEGKRKGRKARGAAEREVEADPREGPLDRRASALCAAAGVFGVLGLLLPLYVGQGFCSTWLPDVPFSSQAFGQFLLALVVAAAAVVGARSRLSRRPALCAGAALALVAYVAGYPFLSANQPGSSPGPGFWACLVAAAAFVAAAGAPSRLSGQSLGSLRRDQRDQRKT
ncbi:MAG: hypothetical protein ACRC20_01085 [Segniliparus sp.]|uniref:hypothetical protein n=1 Tax=Segniliparus sp. TaxID=2804064 RepID=UPI003F32BB25